LKSKCGKGLRLYASPPGSPALIGWEPYGSEEVAGSRVSGRAFDGGHGHDTTRLSQAIAQSKSAGHRPALLLCSGYGAVPMWAAHRAGAWVALSVLSCLS